MTLARQGLPEASLSEGERDLLRQLIAAPRSLRYGSVILTVHDGQLVEIGKTERLRVRTLKPEKV